MTATPAPGSGTQRAPVNAIEIVPSASVSGAISVSFVGTSAIGMGPSETAGVVSKANWNNAVGRRRSAPLPLIDEAGTTTNATFVWNANSTWATPIADQLGNRRMMKGYLDTSNTSVTTISVTGLENRDYDVYVYADGDNRTFSRTAAYTLTGPGLVTTTATLIDQANTNFSGVLIPANNSAGNYIRFSVTGNRLYADRGAADGREYDTSGAGERHSDRPEGFVAADTTDGRTASKSSCTSTIDRGSGEIRDLAACYCCRLRNARISRITSPRVTD